MYKTLAVVKSLRTSCVYLSLVLYQIHEFQMYFWQRCKTFDCEKRLNHLLNLKKRDKKEKISTVT